MSAGPGPAVPEPDAGGWPPADAATRVGQLQRGLGSGARSALASGARASADVLLCVANDPRWDRQLDARADYCARLVAPVGIEVGELAELLDTHHLRASPDDLDRTPFVLSVLERLVDFGDPDAIRVLRRHAEKGRSWASAVEALTYTSDDELRADWERDTASVPNALAERWSTPVELASELGDWWQSAFDREPWRTWVGSHPLVADAVRLSAAAPFSGRRRPDLTAMTTAELLAHDHPGDANPVARALIERTAAADTEAMVTTASDPSSPMYSAAACALAQRGRLESLPAIRSLHAGLRPGVHSTLWRAFRELPIPVSRPIARQWLEIETDTSRRGAGAGFYRAHSLPSDVPFVAAMLTRELDAGSEGSAYVICDMAQALGRHPGAGPHRVLSRAFREMTYSYGRHFVADAIAATDPDFPTTLALDCLWDAERVIRLLGATSVARHLPEAARRLTQLANDRWEDPDVRTAARV